MSSMLVNAHTVPNNITIQAQQAVPQQQQQQQQQRHVEFHLPLPERLEDCRNEVNAKYTAQTERENAMAFVDAETRNAIRVGRSPKFNNGLVCRILFPVSSTC